MQFKRSFFFCMLALSGIASSLPIAPGSHPNSDFKVGSLVYRRGKGPSPPVQPQAPMIKVYDPNHSLIDTSETHRNGTPPPRSETPPPRSGTPPGPPQIGKAPKPRRDSRASPYGQRPRSSTGGKPGAAAAKKPSSGGKPGAGSSAAAVKEAEKMIADLNKLKV
ncbi:hypothetical protein D9611_009280 [Ephemerocybe angulata]|uniref:Uncharacterized protein n=1 Tax=Ephemerocybe angulata TaxID=980116 RepID=A0A8H5F4I8_9AGAR|nr:hypothetical protein D9611_009280 [Tulosesus angulatus]